MSKALFQILFLNWRNLTAPIDAIKLFSCFQQNTAYFSLLTMYPDPTDYQINIFLTSPEDVCCGYSLEAPHRGPSNEYSQHTLLWWRSTISALLVEKKALNLELRLLNVLRFVFESVRNQNTDSTGGSTVSECKLRNGPERDLKLFHLTLFL